MMPRLFYVLLIWAAASAPACSSRRAAESLLLGDHFERSADLAYGPGPRQRLDVYRPEDADRPRPVVLFLYGGRWQSGSRAEYRLIGNALTRRGIVTVIPDYRLYPDTIFPAWVEDAARAVAWTRENVGRFGGDPAQIFVVGHSAGAHTAALLALDEEYLQRVGAAGAVLGFVSIAGPVDTAWTDEDVQALMGPRAGWPATYPASHVDGTEPPLLLLHGMGDETVSPNNSVALEARIRERGGCARAVLYPKVGHVEIAVALALPWLRIAPILEEVVAFTREPRARGCEGGGAGSAGRRVRTDERYEPNR
ncbi:MAG: alpha/beta hydrolase [Gemmatimonadetes bacterium]|nr:alpha/beta hydrolase [Gemmatimonadota bacterium]